MRTHFVAVNIRIDKTERFEWADHTAYCSRQNVIEKKTKVKYLSTVSGPPCIRNARRINHHYYHSFRRKVQCIRNQHSVTL